MPRSRRQSKRKRNIIVRCEQDDNLDDDDNGAELGNFIQVFHGLVKRAAQKNGLVPTQSERQEKNEDDKPAEKLDAKAIIKLETSDHDDTQDECELGNAMPDDDHEYIPESPGSMETDSEDEDDKELSGKRSSLEDDNKRVKKRTSPGPRKKRRLRICTICGHKERAVYKFVEHMLSHENDAAVDLKERHSCDKCDKTFSIKLNLDLHMSNTHTYKKFPMKCDECQMSFSAQKQLIDHLKTKHPGDRPIYQCKSCPRINTSLDQFLRHTRQHSSSKSLKCPLCDLTSFSKLSKLYKHFRTVHADHITKHKCPRCPKVFIIRSSLRAHLLRCGNDEVYCCTICNNDTMFKSKISFQEHMTRRHSGRFVCEQCGNGFISSAELKRHAVRHEGPRFPCPHCPKTYLAESSLTSHLKLHSSDNLHVCDTCGKKFAEKCQLTRHSLTHVDAPPEAICGKCGKTFKTVGSLRYHDKKVHQEKKYECKYCHTMFSRPYNLATHLRVHTGERPFNCLNGCGKNFNRRDIMLAHMSIHGYNKAEALRLFHDHKEKSKE